MIWYSHLFQIVLTLKWNTKDIRIILLQRTFETVQWCSNPFWILGPLPPCQMEYCSAPAVERLYVACEVRRRVAECYKRTSSLRSKRAWGPGIVDQCCSHGETRVSWGWWAGARPWREGLVGPVGDHSHYSGWNGKLMKVLGRVCAHKDFWRVFLCHLSVHLRWSSLWSQGHCSLCSRNFFLWQAAK